MLNIDTPPAVRLALVLILILNTMWVEAIFVGHQEVHEDCFVVCPNAWWIYRRVLAVLIGAILFAPAARLMYVSQTCRP